MSPVSGSYPEARTNALLSLTSRMPDTATGGVSGASAAGGRAARCRVIVVIRGFLSRNGRNLGTREESPRWLSENLHRARSQKKNTAGADPAFRGNALRPPPGISTGRGWSWGPFSGRYCPLHRGEHYLMRLYTRTSAHCQIIPQIEKSCSYHTSVLAGCGSDGAPAPLTLVSSSSIRSSSARRLTPTRSGSRV